VHGALEGRGGGAGRRGDGAGCGVVGEEGPAAGGRRRTRRVGPVCR
jgi:hypothetical protein